MLDRIEELEASYAEQDGRGRFVRPVALETWERILRELLPGRRHGYGESKPPLCRTAAPAGSAEKMKVMAKRVARGEAASHQDDPQHQSAEQEL